MAANNSQLVSAGKPLVSGAINAAPIGTTAPTGTTSELDAKFVKLGYVSEEGLTNAVETDSEGVKAWGGATVLTIRTSRDETFAWTFIQAMDPDVLKEVYGDANVTAASGGEISVKHNDLELSPRVWAFEILLTGGRMKRIVVPSGTITEVGDVVYKDGDPIGYEVTMHAAPDAEGNTAYEYISAPKKPAE